MQNSYEAQRKNMVEMQIRRRGIIDPATLQAMQEVPRHLFVPENLRPYAYDDGPLPVGSGQTISQPYIVALMTQAAEIAPGSIFLEIGTGSGYAAAIASRLAKEVYTIERIPALTEQAQVIINQLNYDNIYFKIGDGTLGWPEKGPFDAIVVTAGAPVIPESFLPQLKVGGRVIIPVGDAISQQLWRLRKLPDNTYFREMLEFVRFVPLIGKEGWQE